ncbi:hypothetical protein ACSMFS_22540 [Shewanella xiamenensis]|uniref:hypothetical protein n=1 Tax=Shewanella xiamenensis TaxID=332186 RepID=UPI003F1B4498
MEKSIKLSIHESPPFPAEYCTAAGEVGESQRCHVDTANNIHSAVVLCEVMKAAVSGAHAPNDRSQNGVFNQIVTNLKGGYGNRIWLKSGKFESGICLPLCPFCGGELMSKEEAEMYQIQASHVINGG